MRIKKLLEITNGTIYNYKKININKFKIDSREISINDCFIALDGKTSGNNYIKDAIKNKASLIITNTDIDDNIPYIKVENTYDTLFDIAKYYLNKYNKPVIAITGSNGKTTTKELIYEILSKKYNVLKNYKNYNNHIGVPLTLFNLNKNTDLILLEFGMNHKGEIARLKALTNPELSIITSVGTAHIGNLGSLKNISRAKLEIKNKELLVNKDSKYLSKYDGVSIKDVYNIKSTIEYTTFNIKIDNKEYLIKFNIPGIHLITNVLLSIKVGLMYNIDIIDIIESINNFKNIDKRMNIIKKNYILINDCYNSSLESLEGSINLIKNYKNKKLLILGDIKELGKYSGKIHKQINKRLKKVKNATILSVGEETKVFKGIHFNNNNEIIDYLKKINLDNYLILVKGSRLMKLEEISDYLIK